MPFPLTEEEIKKLEKEEFDRRRIMRLNQVRQIENQRAKEVINCFKQDKIEAQKEKIRVKQDEELEELQVRLKSLQAEYDTILNNSNQGFIIAEEFSKKLAHDEIIIV